MRKTLSSLFLLLLSFQLLAQNNLKVELLDSLGDKQLDVYLRLQNLSDDYLLIEKGVVEYVVEYKKEDSIKTKTEHFNIGLKLLDPKQKVKKDKIHLDLLIGSKGKYLKVLSYESKLVSHVLKIDQLKSGLVSEGFVSIKKGEEERVDMKELGEITLKENDGKLMALYSNNTKQKRKFTLEYHFFDLRKPGFSNKAKASSNILQKVKPKQEGKLVSTEGGGKYQFMDDELLVKPILFKSIKTTKRGYYYSFQNGDFGDYTVELGADPIYISKIDGASSNDVEDFFIRKID